MATVYQNLSALQARHYLRHATAPNRWFEFANAKVKKYQKRYGDDFWLIVNGSHERDDAYVLPFAVAREVFTSDALDSRGRWVGTIIGSKLLLTPSNKSLMVAPYHNAFGLLGL